MQSEMATFDDLEYCKTDLIAAKGIVFCKYSKTSSALRALESVQQTGMVNFLLSTSVLCTFDFALTITISSILSAPLAH